MPGRRNTHQMVVWLTPVEKDLLKQQANSTLGPDGRPMSVSQYIRMLIQQNKEQSID